ncbi:MAG: glycosyltransferase [Lachnospiraceae bacterium]|nr:glycosyltransferase [Lachnospiraceae bacterium]
MGRIKRAVRYYKRHGLTKTVDKTFRVLFKSKWKYEDVTFEELQRERRVRFPYAPKLSVLIPMYRTPVEYFRELLDAFQGQTYGNWELCLADGSGMDTEAYYEVLSRQKKDSRIKYKRLESNDGISGNTNQALDMATGDYVVLCDHDDMITPDAFFRIVEALNADRSIDTIYTDEDKVDMTGKKHFDPTFKPDYNIDYFRAGNYICHMFVTRREIAEKVRFKSEYDGAQDFDFIFRCAENSKVIHHIPRILYHWRCHVDSTAMNPQSKAYAYEAGEKAVRDHLARCGVKAKVARDKKRPGYVKVLYLRDDVPSVTVVTTKKIRSEVIEGIDYPKFDVVYAEEYTPAGLNRVLDQIHGEYVLFIDDRMSSLPPKVIRHLVGPLCRDDLSGSFAKVYAKNNTLFSAGAVIGMYHAFGMAFCGVDRKVDVLGMRLTVPQDMSASDLTCAMFRTEDLKKTQGFDETMRLPYAGVDMFLQIHAITKKMFISLPYVVGKIDYADGLDYGVSISEDLEQRELFAEKWKEVIEAGDPAYNMNFEIKRTDYYPRRKSILIKKGIIEN